MNEPDIIGGIEEQLRQAAHLHEVAENSRRVAIRQAVQFGLSERWIGERVGLSGPRINQIKKELANG